MQTNTNTKDKYKAIQEEVSTVLTAQELQELRVFTLLSTGGNMLHAVARSTGVARGTAVAGVTRVQEKVMCSVLKLTHCGDMSLASYRSSSLESSYKSYRSTLYTVLSTRRGVH